MQKSECKMQKLNQLADAKKRNAKVKTRNAERESKMIDPYFCIPRSAFIPPYAASFGAAAIDAVMAPLPVSVLNRTLNVSQGPTARERTP